MTLDEILASLFPDGHALRREGGLVAGTARLKGGGEAVVVGVEGRTPLGVEGALTLAGPVLDALERGGEGPIVVLVDSDSQRMSRRDELLGLNEFLAHLAKALIVADLRGRRTVGVLYGHTAAGAFIATALATSVLVGLPGADPEVMDLPSMSRVTKLSVDVLREKAKSTPVFAPGLDNLARTGAVLETWDPKRSLADQFAAVLAREGASLTREGASLTREGASLTRVGASPARGGASPAREAPGDRRDALGLERAGRPKAADIAERVRELATRAG